MTEQQLIDIISALRYEVSNNKRITIAEQVRKAQLILELERQRRK